MIKNPLGDQRNRKCESRFNNNNNNIYSSLKPIHGYDRSKT